MAQILDTLTLESHAPYAAALAALATLRSTQADLAAAVVTAQSTYNDAADAAANADERFVAGDITAEERTPLLAAVSSAQAALTGAQNDLAVCDEMVFQAVGDCRGATEGAEIAGVSTISSEWQGVVAEVATAHAALATAVEAVGTYFATLKSKLSGPYTSHGVEDRINQHLQMIAGVNTRSVEANLERLLLNDLKVYLDVRVQRKHMEPALRIGGPGQERSPK